MSKYLVDIYLFLEVDWVNVDIYLEICRKYNKNVEIRLLFFLQEFLLRQELNTMRQNMTEQTKVILGLQNENIGKLSRSFNTKKNCFVLSVDLWGVKN